MEEALDLRIHNRRDDDETSSSWYYSSRHHYHQHSQVEFVLTTTKFTTSYRSIEEDNQDNDDGDLVIVEAEVKDDTPPFSSPSPSARSSDTDTDRSSNSLVPSSSAQGGQNSYNNEDAQKKGNNTRCRFTSKHVSGVDRMLKPTRLMCFLCDQKAKNGKTLETHIQKSHSIQTDQGRFLCCTSCTFRCECDQMLGLDQLKSHFEMTHGSTTRGRELGGKSYYPCNHCSRIYRKQSLLEAHMRLVNQKDMWKKNNVYVNT